MPLIIFIAIIIEQDATRQALHLPQDRPWLTELIIGKTQRRQHLYRPVASSEQPSNPTDDPNRWPDPWIPAGPIHIWGAAIISDSISFPTGSNESGGKHKIQRQHQIRAGQQPVLPIGHGQWQINVG
ncbi:hypothetical protein ACLOJK_012896 [Asimina triloba]